MNLRIKPSMLTIPLRRTIALILLVAPSKLIFIMDVYSLASEIISPFFDSIDGIALAIADHIPGLGLPSPELDVDPAFVLHSSTQTISYYQQHRVHS
ncbi:hypothetical protein NA56DRAFT_77077 [Hyaloscypha hepaticicola]|uniref:Uncharacterized protein n=1 Tax=Hyaloscypha hepaticicola TaxID=2082293 RepID=A0A2J6Q9B2_9HELO|nr:hypothetical protein NA56DRAFT_77077 [Hyaloscypha hepaticicola]